MFIDITNQTFGMLKVKSKVGKNKKGYIVWSCLCECGNTVEVRSDHLRSGNTKSCGCLRSVTNTKHGQSKHKLYGVWRGIKQRCYYPKHDSFKNYGARGITMCNEWRDSFKEFFEWSIKNGYAENLEIDRIDNDSGYSPENCRYITKSENCKNRR